MFRALGTTCSRAIASSSTSTHLLPQFLLPSFSASLHTTRPVLESARKEHARLRKKRNTEFRIQRAVLERQAAPHPVLGQPDTPEGEAQWQSCDLARLLVDERALEEAPIPELSTNKIDLPELYQFGIGGSDERILFQTLPALNAQSGLMNLHNAMSDAQVNERLTIGVERSHMQANYLARIVDLRNASAAGMAFENRRRCIVAFGEHESDSGRPEVQAAVLTMQIRNLWNHLKTHRKDVHNRRSLKTMVHQRAKILKYLERLDPARFDDVLPRLGLDPRAIKGEIIVRF